MGLEFLAQPFMQRALIAGALVGLAAPSIGLFLVLRRYALLAQGLGQIAFGGAALGLLLGIDPTAGAFALAAASAGTVEVLRDRGRLGGDTAIGVLTALGLAIGAVAGARAGAAGHRLVGFLFGSIVLVSPRDLVVLAGITALLLGALGLFRKGLVFACFDEEAARASGLPVRPLNHLLAVLAALAVVATLRITGSLLVFALMVLPAATALRVARSFRGAQLLAVAFGQLAVTTGLVTAYHLNVPAGGAIVLTAGALFLAVSLAHAAVTRGRAPRSFVDGLRRAS